MPNLVKMALFAMLACSKEDNADKLILQIV